MQELQVNEVEQHSARVRSRFRTRRSWQLAVLDQLNIPKGLRSKDDRPVKPVELASLFRTIDSRAREDGWYMLPIQDEVDEQGNVVTRGLASESHLSLRQCKRCLEVAQAKGWIEKQVIPQKSGADRCWWRLVFHDLAARLTTLPLWSDTPGPECPPADSRVPNATEPSARSKPPACPNDTPQVPNREGASAHAGTHRNAQETPQEARIAPSDGTSVVDGARSFSSEELEDIRHQANYLNIWLGATKDDDRELVLKVATLRHDGRLSEDQVEQFCESCQRKRDAGEPYKPFAWLWAVMRNQCADVGDSFDRLLATTDFPRELLPLPQQRTHQTADRVARVKWLRSRLAGLRAMHENGGGWPSPELAAEWDRLVDEWCNAEIDADMEGLDTGDFARLGESVAELLLRRDNLQSWYEHFPEGRPLSEQETRFVSELVRLNELLEGNRFPGHGGAPDG